MRLLFYFLPFSITFLFINCSSSGTRITRELSVDKASQLIKRDSSYVDLIQLVELLKMDYENSSNNLIWKSKYKNLSYNQIQKYVNRINDSNWVDRTIEKAERAYERYTESLLKDNKPWMFEHFKNLSIEDNNPADYFDIELVDVRNSRGWYGCRADYSVFQVIPLQDTITEIEFRFYAKNLDGRFITFDGVIKTEISDTIEISLTTGERFDDLYCSGNTILPIDEIKSSAEFTFLKEKVMTKSGDTILFPDPVINNQKYLKELKSIQETLIYDSGLERLTIDEYKLSRYNSPKEITTTHSWWKWYHAVADNQLTDDEIYFILDPKESYEFEEDYLENELKKYQPLAHEFFNELKEDRDYHTMLNRYVAMQYVNNYQD
ncbi:MAG: hypothetical protein OXC92_08390 [Flavobacteriaceae bacterium]|nr:hypothetical protein [Flavobacteriaceae bacterium]